MAYPTIAECKAYSTKIPEVTAATDAEITARISEAKRLIHNFCHQEFDVPETAVTKYFNGNDSDILRLFPRCSSLTSVIDNTYNFTALVNLKYGNNYSKLEALYPVYGLGPRYRVRDRSDGAKMFCLGSNNVAVLGNWGWSDVPAAIKEVCIMIVEKLMVKRFDVRQWMTPFESESMPGGYSYRKGSFLKMIFDEEIVANLSGYVYEQIGVYRV